MKKSIFLLILLFGIAGAVYFFTREDGDNAVVVAINSGDRVFDIEVKGCKNEITRNVKASKIPLNKYDFAIFYK